MDNVMKLVMGFGRLALPIFMALQVSGVVAQTEPTHLGKNTDWDVYELDTAQGKVCYIASEPLTSKPEVEGRGPTWVLVTHRPAANVSNEVGIIAGYSYQSGAAVTVLVDTEKFELFTQDDGAWLRTSEEETAMVAAMKRGKRMSVVGYSSTGVTTTDEYSLIGFTASHRQMSEACNVR